MELPISFFLDYAWNPDAMPLEKLPSYTTDWAAEQFGSKHAKNIAALLDGYTKLNARRKPELIAPGTFSLTAYNEAERVLAEWQALARKSESVKAALPVQYQDAYAQLVWYPIQSSMNLNELYIAAAKNALYAEQGRASTNIMAKQVQTLFDRDADLTRFYHEDIADGKWNHFMSQTHIGYTYWQQPNQNNIPKTTTIRLPKTMKTGVSTATLPDFDIFNKQVHTFEVFAQGSEISPFTIDTQQDWTMTSQSVDMLTGDTIVAVEIDWDKVPEGHHDLTLTVRAENDGPQIIASRVHKPTGHNQVVGYVASNGAIAIDAENYSRKIDSGNVHWARIDNLGRTGSSVTAFPVTRQAEPLASTSPHLEYDIHVWDAGDVDIEVTLAPTLDFLGNGGLRYAISIDDQDPVMVNINEFTQGTSGAWNKLVADYAHVHKTSHQIGSAGAHTVKIWLVDPALVFQRVTVLTNGALPYSYLGPQHSPLANAKP